MEKYSQFHKIGRLLSYRESQLRSFLSRLNLKVWPDDRVLSKYKDCFGGRRCFILGNGPSLRVEDLNRLGGEVTFASNKVYLAFDKTEWRPSFYTLCDLLVAAQNVEQIRRLEMPKFITNYARSFLFPCKNTVWFNELAGNFPLTTAKNLEDLSPESLRFSIDATAGLEGGGTVIFNQLQLAYFFGFSDVIVIGLDFSFNTGGLKTADSFFDKSMVSKGEVNHFHPDYRKPGELWSVPNMELQRLAFRAAKEKFEADGRSVVNASRSTKLDVFRRVDFDTLF